MARPSCAQALVQALEDQGVRHMFIGPPGEHVVELYDAILDSKQIQGYLATNEYTLSFMADGYSRASGKVGVFTLVPGPGVTNALTGIVEAFTDSSPLVGIISDVRMHIEESFQLHQIPNLELLAPVIKRGFRLEDPAEVASVVAEAFRVAMDGEPGPVMIEIPCDVYPMHSRVEAVQPAATESPVKEDRIEEFARILRESRRPGIYLGRGCFEAAAEVRKLCEILEAPVASSVNGRGILPESHPLSVGFGFGRNGSKISQEVFAECDAVLAIGCKFGEVSTGSFSFKLPQRLLHVDINPANLNRVFKTEHALACDARRFLASLLLHLGEFRRPQEPALREKIQQGKLRFQEELRGEAPRFDSVDPGKFYLELRDRLQAEDVLTVDIGNHELWAISCYPVLAKGTFLCPTNFSAMGFAIPAAIAAKILHPERRAVCCVGDGGFLMSGFEILTAVRYRLPVVFCVFNDGALGITKGLQSRIFRRTAFVDLRNPDYRKIAEAYGLPYFLMAQDEDVGPVLDQALSLGQPALIELKVKYDRMSPFLKGIVLHRVKVTPWREKIHVARRWIKRAIFSGAKA